MLLFCGYLNANNASNCCKCCHNEFPEEVMKFKNSLFDSANIGCNKYKAFLSKRSDWECDNLEATDFDNLEPMAKGHNGAVYRFVDNENYVLKVLKRSEQPPVTEEEVGKTKTCDAVKNTNIVSESDIESLERVSEISFSSFLCNQDIDSLCKYYAVFDDPKSSNYYVILEKVTGKTLEQSIREGIFMKKNKKSFNVEVILKTFQNLLNAVKSLHEKNLVHMDLKADNVFINRNGDVKLIDMGSGCHLQHVRKVITKRGSIRNFSKDYARMLLKNNGIIEKEGSCDIADDQDICKKYDIWCCGLILYEMVFRKVLFSQYSFGNIVKFITSGNNRYNYTKKVYQERESFNIKNDPLIKNINYFGSDGKIFAELLSAILTREDSDRKNIDDLVSMIEEYNNRTIVND